MHQVRLLKPRKSFGWNFAAKVANVDLSLAPAVKAITLVRVGKMITATHSIQHSYRHEYCVRLTDLKKAQTCTLTLQRVPHRLPNRCQKTEITSY